MIQKELENNDCFVRPRVFYIVPFSNDQYSAPIFWSNSICILITTQFVIIRKVYNGDYAVILNYVNIHEMPNSRQKPLLSFMSFCQLLNKMFKTLGFSIDPAFNHFQTFLISNLLNFCTLASLNEKWMSFPHRYGGGELFNRLAAAGSARTKQRLLAAPLTYF